MKASEDCYRVPKEYSVKRAPKRARYAKDDIHAIIDAAYLCHISFVEQGKPTAVPMACWRQGEHLYFHAANRGRLSRLLAGQEVCISIALFDGLVLGHSAFNHSYNFRSVVIHSRVEEVSDATEKQASMRAFMDHFLPGRWDDIRPIREHELRATTLFRAELIQVAGKIRDEFPDEETDSPEWPTWIGVIPAALRFAGPDADPRRNRMAGPPGYIADYRGVDRHEPRYRTKC